MYPFIAKRPLSPRSCHFYREAANHASLYANCNGILLHPCQRDNGNYAPEGHIMPLDSLICMDSQSDKMPARGKCPRHGVFAPLMTRGRQWATQLPLSPYQVSSGIISRADRKSQVRQCWGLIFGPPWSINQLIKTQILPNLRLRISSDDK